MLPRCLRTDNSRGLASYHYRLPILRLFVGLFLITAFKICVLGGFFTGRDACLIVITSLGKNLAFGVGLEGSVLRVNKIIAMSARVAWVKRSLKENSRLRFYLREGFKSSQRRNLLGF